MASDDNVQLRTLSPRPSERVESSPARDALRGNLKASEADLGLKKRKSWFGSMRDVFHKGALQAKAAVDSMRGDQVKCEDETKPMMESNKSPHHNRVTPEPRQSLDSAASTTPLKSHTFSPQINRRRTFSPREAVSSLRQRLPGHVSRSKRGSIYTIAGRKSTDAEEIPGPEQFASPKGLHSDDIDQHRRMSSVASSLVGSIRGLARRPTMKSRATTSMEPSGPEETADEVPLPSSPINIPSAAPVLGLDLGQPGMNFMPIEMAGAAQHVRGEDTLKLQDPANFALDGATGRKSSLPLVPDEVKAQYTHPAIRQKPATPREMLLALPNESLKRSPPTAPPATPMPGTNLGLELDGASDDASSGKKSAVFERSVTPTTQKDRKELRRMCSLDAVAGACTSARKDSNVEVCETVNEEYYDCRQSESGVSPQSNPFISPRVSIPSASTVSTCPSDMQELERQKSTKSRLCGLELSERAGRYVSTTPVPVDDPFDDSHVAAHGPPSPVRSVKLPLRLKIKGPTDESGGSVEASLSPTPVEDQQDVVPLNQYAFESPTKLSTQRGHGTDHDRHLQRSYGVPQNLSGIDQRPVSPLSPEQTEILSDDDTMARAESLWNSDVVYPGYDEYPLSEDGTSEDGMSPHGGPIVPAPLQQADFSHGGSSGRSTWKAGSGLGAEGFKFSIDTWRPGPQPIPDPQPQTTPDRRAMDISIDIGSADDSFETPIDSRASTKSGRTPSMGNKLELDARRSERNMRYNAIQQEQGQEKKSSSPVRMHARFIFGGSSGDMDTNEAQHYPESSNAHTSPLWGTPEKGRQGPGRISSEDSMTMSLRSASDNMEKLRALLGDIDSDGEKGQGEDEIFDVFTTASSPRSKRPVVCKNRVLRSDSPSPEATASHPLPATPVLGPLGFSPTAARDNESPNRFTVLDVEVDIGSSPASDVTATAELPIGIDQHQDQRQRQYQQHSNEDRVVSGDTLDQTLDMLSSPDSGYQADDSSTPGTEKQIPRRYRSQSSRMKDRKVLGEIDRNEV